MTAPTPERRVGEERPRVEAERVAHLAAMSDETVAGNFPAGGTMRALSRDLLDARTALIEVSSALHTEHQRVISLTAEVERLTKEKAEVTSMAWELVRLVQSVPVPHDPIVVASIRSRLAVLAPSPAPLEGTNDE